MRITGTLTTFKLDVDQYTRELRRHLIRQIEEAARHWLRAVLLDIPIWSGASVGTFHKLASQVQMSDVTRVRPKQGVKAGFQLGASQREGEFDTDKDFYRFTYSTTLRHLIYNEFNNANITPDPGLFSRLITPGPYRFQEKGLAAFREFAGNVHLPRPRVKKGRRRRIR